MSAVVARDALGREVAVDSTVTDPERPGGDVGVVVTLTVVTGVTWIVVRWPDGTRDALRAEHVVVVKPVDRSAR